MGRSRWAAPVWLALLAACLAGCGADGGSNTAAPSAASSAQRADGYASHFGSAASMAGVVKKDQYGGASSGEGSAAARDDAGAAPAAGAKGAFSGTVQGRMLIYTANVTMEVENYAEAYTEIQNLIHLSNGYIVRFSEQTNDKERSGHFTIKVPAQDFDGFMRRLEEIPNVGLSRSVNAQDVTEEFVDLEARLSAKQVVEGRYLEYMEGASRAEDLIRYTNELAAVQEEIERLKGRIRYLEANVEYSTVELRVYEKAGPGGASPLGRKMAGAMHNSLNALAATAEAVMVIAAGSVPIAAAAGVIGLPIYWFAVRKRRGKAEAFPVKAQEPSDE